MLLWLLVKGVLVGIIIAVPAGPVGVLCIRRTIFNGQLAGFLSGLGAATADAVFGIIAGFGLTVISDVLLDYQNWLRVGGAAFLLYIGVSAFTADPLAGTQAQRDPDGLFADYVSTFALTITNPITILAFLAIFAGIGFTGEEATLGRAVILVLGVWLILFGIINFTYTWYDPKGGVGPKEFADLAVELFLNGFAPGNAAKPAVANRREKV